MKLSVSSKLEMPHYACSIAPVISPVTSSGELAATSLSATLRPRRSTTTRSAMLNTSGMRWLMSTMAMPLVAQLPDEIEDLGDLPHRDRRGRLVHQHDLGVGNPGSGDGHRLSLAARHLPDQIARPGFGSQLGEDLSGPAIHRGIVENLERADAFADFAAEENIGGSAEIVAEREILMHDLDAVLARFDRPVHGQILAFHLHRAMRRDGNCRRSILTRVDLPAPLSPISPTTWPGSSDSETSLSAWMAPKCFETFFSSRRAIPDSPCADAVAGDARLVLEQT